MKSHLEEIALKIIIIIIIIIIISIAQNAYCSQDIYLQLGKV